MKNKRKEDYITIFKKIKEHISEFLGIGEHYEISEIHTDFEIAIGQAAKHVFQNVTIKYCIWHLKRALNLKKNELCKTVIDNEDKYFILYNMITNLYLCEPNYVVSVFNKIKIETENESFINFLTYVEETYIKKFGYKNWNYFKNVTHATNNSCESYNNKLNGLFKVKPIFFKLVYELRLEESNIVNAFNKRNAGLIGYEIKRKAKTGI
jgi:SHS2 domain-containing protein